MIDRPALSVPQGLYPSVAIAARGAGKRDSSGSQGILVIRATDYPILGGSMLDFHLASLGL